MTTIPAAPHAGAPGTTTQFRADIQGLRGLAVLLVVLFHTRGVVPGGYIGVDVFFVVSGFVITGLLQSQLAAPGGLRLRDFYARRVRRLLPMLALTLSVTAVLGVLLLSPLGASATTSKTAVAAALLNANTFLSRQSADYFALAPDANALLHTWSLSVEEQFYLVLPGLLALVAAVARRRRGGNQLAGGGRASGAVLAVAAGLAVGSFALYALLVGGGGDEVISRLRFTSPESFAFYSAPTRAWEFLAGAVLALLVPRLGALPSTVRTTTAAVGLVVVLACAALFDASTALSPLPMLLPVVGTVLLLMGGTAANPVSDVLSRRGPVWLGDLSYGWYLFHWPLIVFATANTSAAWAPFAAAAAGLGLAVGAKRVVEDRFRFDARWTGRRAALLGAACIALPVVAGVGSVVADRVLRIEDLAAAGARHADSERGCNRRESGWLPLDADECTWSVPDAKGRIVLLGDSHAAMWTEAVVEAGNRLGYDVTVATMSGCPIVAGTERDQNGGADVDCAQFVRRTLQESVILRPTVVILGAGSTGVLSEREEQRWRRPDGTWTSDPDEVAEIWEQGLASAVGRLAAAGVPSVIVHDIPYHELTNASCGRLRYLLSPTSCAATVDRREYEVDRALGRRIESRVDARNPLATTLDPAPWLCDRGRCSTYSNGTWSYRDGDHLSVAGSLALADRMERYLRSRGL